MKKVIFLSLFFCLSMIFFSCGNTATDSNTVKQPDSASTQPSTTLADPMPAGTAEVETLKGTFVSIEQGDYMHFNMVDEQGVDRSFFFATEMPESQVADFESGKNNGKKVEITWRTVERDIPEAGGKMEIEEILSAKVVE